MKIRVVERNHHGTPVFIIQIKRWYQIWFKDCTTVINRKQRVMRFANREQAERIIKSSNMARYFSKDG